MNKSILIELVQKWGQEANPLEEDIAHDASVESRISEAKEFGKLEGIAKCADELEQLIKLLG